MQLDGLARDELSALIAAGLDFDLIVRDAGRHGVVPLVSRQFHALAAGSCPVSTLAQLRELTAHSVRTSLGLAAELVQVIDALRATDVPALAIKGPIAAALCYGDLGLRTFSDIDLVVDASDVERAARCLQARGYAPAQRLPPGGLKQLVRSYTEQLYRHSDGNRLVDLHWALMPRGYSFSPTRSGPFAITQTVRIGQTDVRTLGSEATLIFLLLHGMKHDWESLGWLCDVAELIRRQSALDWDSVLAWSDRPGPRRFVDIGLALAHAVLEAPVPTRVLARGKHDPLVGDVTGTLVTRMREPAGDLEPVLAENFSLTYFRAMQNRRDQLRFIYDIVLRPTPVEWNAAPLPRALAPLHFLVRPVRLLWKHTIR